MNENVFADDMNYSNFNVGNLFINPFFSKKKRAQAAQNVNRGLVPQRDVLQSIVKPRNVSKSQRALLLASLSGLTLAQLQERQKRLKSLPNEQIELVIKRALGSRRKRTGIFSTNSITLLNRIQAQAQAKKKIEEALQVSNSQIEIDKLRQELEKLRMEIEKAKQDLQQQAQIPAPQVQRIAQNIEAQPNIEVDTQVENVAAEVVDESIGGSDVQVEDRTTDMQKIDAEPISQTPPVQTPPAVQQAGLPKWLLPALLIGGVAYFVMKKN
jgi:hypothetical protein